MTISIRKRKLKNDTVRLYLDCYDKGKRFTEFLDLFLYENPKNPSQREHNREANVLTEKIRSKKLLAYQENAHGFSSDLSKSSFIEYFKTLTKERRNSAGNFGNWSSALKILIKFADNQDLKFSQVDEGFLNRFKKYLLSEKLTKSNTLLAQNSALSYFNKVRAALNQAFEDKIISENPAKRIKPIKQAETNRQCLTWEELKLADMAECKSEVLKRAFMFSALTGLRWCDVNALLWDDITKSENGYTLQFRQQKTKGVEHHPISQEAYDYLPAKEKEGRVFVGLKYSSESNVKIARWMMNAGIKKHITFHCARHSYATIMMTNKVDLYTISKLLGHRELKTTQIYVKVVDQLKIDAVNSFPSLNSDKA